MTLAYVDANLAQQGVAIDEIQDGRHTVIIIIQPDYATGIASGVIWRVRWGRRWIPARINDWPDRETYISLPESLTFLSFP